LTQFDPLDQSLKFRKLKKKTAATAILKNRKLAIFQKCFDPNTAKLGKVTHIVMLTVLTVNILKFYKSTMVAVAILTKKN